jgi:hypothetical protein
MSMDGDYVSEPRWNDIDRKNQRLGENPVLALCPPQIPHGLTRSQTRASVVRGWRLDAWATAWSTTVTYGYVLIYLLCIRMLPQIHAPHIEIRRPVTTLWEQTYWHCWERWLCHVGWSWVAEVMSRKLRTILCFLLFSPFQTRRFRV